MNNTPPLYTLLGKLVYMYKLIYMYILIVLLNGLQGIKGWSKKVLISSLEERAKWGEPGNEATTHTSFSYPVGLSCVQ